MSQYVSAQCDSCLADIIWAVSASTGARMPVDYEPADDGNIALRAMGALPPVATVLNAAQRFGRTGLRKSHFATCPNAARHRKRGKA